MRFFDRLREERGMTMIELMVAATVCAIGIAATIGVMDQSRLTSQKSEKRDVLAQVAEREVETDMALPWVNFQHSAQPVANGTPAGNPSTYVTGTSYKYDRTNASLTEPLVWSATNGQISATYTAWDDAQTRLTGRVYRYVTRIDGNSRRLTVVVIANGVNPPAPVLVSTIKTNPIL